MPGSSIRDTPVSHKTECWVSYHKLSIKVTPYQSLIISERASARFWFRGAHATRVPANAPSRSRTFCSVATGAAPAALLSATQLPLPRRPVAPEATQAEPRRRRVNLSTTQLLLFRVSAFHARRLHVNAFEVERWAFLSTIPSSLNTSPPQLFDQFSSTILSRA
jgi:hypothetical protein